jgi:phosphoribosyl-dephospho-CoA transferase
MSVFCQEMALLPHDLLRLNDPGDLVCHIPMPAWSHQALRQAPWVVVRRAQFENELIPVGVRGKNRNERLAAFLCPPSVVQWVRPEDLVSCRAWKDAAGRKDFPPMRALPQMCVALEKLGLSWGPVGSVGFELATGFSALSFSSDLDLIIRRNDVPDPRLVEKLVAVVEGAEGRVDVLIETAAGAIALAELARNGPSVLLRTLNGPRLIQHPLLR